MTFSLLGRCPQTGQIGAAVTTSSIAVGARVAFAAAGIGAVLTQHRTDPRLGPRGLALLRDGCDAQQTIAALVASTGITWRQVAAIDARGGTAAHSGARVKPEHGACHGPDVVAIGNILADRGVPAAMVRGFVAEPAAPLADRLLRGLEAGLAAGGEHLPVRSAHLLVVAQQSFPLIDLRIDWHDEPIAALRDLWQRYEPLVEDYVHRATAPDDAIAL